MAKYADIDETIEKCFGHLLSDLRHCVVAFVIPDYILIVLGNVLTRLSDVLLPPKPVFDMLVLKAIREAKGIINFHFDIEVKSSYKGPWWSLSTSFVRNKCSGIQFSIRLRF